MQLVIPESMNKFACYASGRRNCLYLLATLNLKPRQDLGMLLFGLVYPQARALAYFRLCSARYLYLWDSGNQLLSLPRIWPCDTVL